MGYFKNTLYYGPNNEDLSDNSTEALYERRVGTHRQPKVEWHHYPVIKTAKCSKCNGEPTFGKLWAHGPYQPLICDKCKESQNG